MPGSRVRLSRIITAKNRAELVSAVELAPLGAQFELMDEPRTTAQNKLLWSLLGSVSDQLEHGGRKYEPNEWKCIFMKALGKELSFVPSLDGNGIVAVGYSSSRLSKEEFSNLIELIYSEGAKRGVAFHGEAA
jgi:hypothetical protein